MTQSQNDNNLRNPPPARRDDLFKMDAKKNCVQNSVLRGECLPNNKV